MRAEGLTLQGERREGEDRGGERREGEGGGGGERIGEEGVEVAMQPVDPCAATASHVSVRWHRANLTTLSH